MKLKLSVVFILLFISSSFYLNYQPLSVEMFTQSELRFTISGEVLNPGTYTVEGSSFTLEHAISLAGGVTVDAQVVLPLQKEIKYDEYIVIPKQVEEKRISINYATIEEIVKIPGVGPSTAERIITYREQVGLFHRIEDIMNVKGIKQKLFEKMLPYITL